MALGNSSSRNCADGRSRRVSGAHRGRDVAPSGFLFANSRHRWYLMGGLPKITNQINELMKGEDLGGEGIWGEGFGGGSLGGEG